MVTREWCSKCGIEIEFGRPHVIGCPAATTSSTDLKPIQPTDHTQGASEIPLKETTQTKRGPTKAVDGLGENELPYSCRRCGYVRGAHTPECLTGRMEKSLYLQRTTQLIEEQQAIMESRFETYGDSYTDEGLDGLIFDILRKLRRLWHIVMVEGKPPRAEDTVDLANYSIMLQALGDVDPESVKRMKVRARGGLFVQEPKE